jgi:nucleotide-binding universal stress UspA family protein
MFHRIVVSLDGSELAERALEWATELARAANVLIHLIRVIDLGMIDGGGLLVWGLSPWALDRALDEEQKAALDSLERTRQRLKDQGAQAFAEMRHGRAPDEIVASITEDDLVVMSTHARGGLPRYMYHYASLWHAADPDAHRGRDVRLDNR